MPSVIDVSFNNILQFINLFRSVMVKWSAVIIVALQILQLSEVFLQCLFDFFQGTVGILRNTPFILLMHILSILFIEFTWVAIQVVCLFDTFIGEASIPTTAANFFWTKDSFHPIFIHNLTSVLVRYPRMTVMYLIVYKRNADIITRIYHSSLVVFPGYSMTFLVEI